MEIGMFEGGESFIYFLFVGFYIMGDRFINSVYGLILFIKIVMFC